MRTKTQGQNAFGSLQIVIYFNFSTSLIVNHRLSEADFYFDSIQPTDVKIDLNDLNYEFNALPIDEYAKDDGPGVV